MFFGFLICFVFKVIRIKNSKPGSGSTSFPFCHSVLRKTKSLPWEFSTLLKKLRYVRNSDSCFIKQTVLPTKQEKPNLSISRNNPRRLEPKPLLAGLHMPRWIWKTREKSSDYPNQTLTFMLPFKYLSSIQGSSSSILLNLKVVYRFSV